ncbi:AbgT family transporter [Bacillus sp. SCS-153A]|uniref:AbgT family transporter n=1 Tax=Rossellomorea sedimentorum TaxID=3115294 RepID=UPI003905B69E
MKPGQRIKLHRIQPAKEYIITYPEDAPGFYFVAKKRVNNGKVYVGILPYSIILYLIWLILLIAFALLGIPFGPGVHMYL